MFIMDQDSWNVECSDDECDVKNGVYEPSPEEIERLYNILDEGRIPGKCL